MLNALLSYFVQYSKSLLSLIDEDEYCAGASMNHETSKIGTFYVLKRVSARVTKTTKTSKSI